MNMLPMNSDLQPPYGDRAKTYQVTTKSHYRRRDTDLKAHNQDLDWNNQNVNRNGPMDTPTTTHRSERDQDQTILDPDRQDEEIVDPKRGFPEREFPNQEDDEDINPTRNVPDEDNDLDDDGSFIKEPSRELDDPYQPDQVERENVAPNREEFPNSIQRENTESL